MPPSIRMVLTDPDASPAVAASYEGEAGVYEVRQASETMRQLETRWRALETIAPPEYGREIADLIEHWRDGSPGGSADRLDAIDRMKDRCRRS